MEKLELVIEGMHKKMDQMEVDHDDAEKDVEEKYRHILV